MDISKCWQICISIQSPCVGMNTTGIYNLYDPWDDLFAQDGHGRNGSGTTTRGKGGGATEESVSDGL